MKCSAPGCYTALMWVAFALAGAPRVRAEAAPVPLAGDEEKISPAGIKWREFLDGKDVEHRWPAGVHVDWKSGLPDGKPEREPKHATHCSAFVAALAEELHIPLLRPPQHKTARLANAQYDWLIHTGPLQGWTVVTTPLEAQQRANRGEWVLAVYKATRAGKSGHIAVVRPAVRAAIEIDREGPEVIQAGQHNYNSAPLARGFASHPNAWKGAREVRFFAHALSP